MLDRLSSQTTKNRIMDAAEDVVVRLGAAHLTFDVLVKETGLSKGGILYHFPNKKTLLREMMQRMIEAFNERRTYFENKDRSGLVKAKSYVRAAMQKDKHTEASSAALMAVAANDPELLQIIREHYQENFTEIRATASKSDRAALIYLATDGLWLLDALQLCPLTDQERQGLKTVLLNIADGKNIITD